MDEIDDIMNELGIGDDVSGVEILGRGQRAAVVPDRYTLDSLLAGFPVTTVGIGATVAIPVTVSRPIRARQLVLGVAARVAGVRVTAITVGAVNQNLGNGPIPADMLTSDQTFSLAGDTIIPGTGAVITVVNTTAGAIDVDGAFVGPAAVGGRAG